MYSLKNDGKTYTPAPLTPKKVYEDQLKLKQEATSESIQTNNHDEIVRKTENKTSHELNNKRDKVSATREREESFDQNERKGVKVECG
jgi:hypothetical protein